MWMVRRNLLIPCGLCRRGTSEILECQNCWVQSYCSRRCQINDHLNHRAICEKLKQMSQRSVFEIPAGRLEFDKFILDGLIGKVLKDDRVLEKKLKMTYIFVELRPGIVGLIKINVQEEDKIQKLQSLFGNDVTQLVQEFFSTGRPDRSEMKLMIITKKDNDIRYHPLILSS